MKRLSICIIAIIVVFGACSRRPGYVIPEPKMVNVLYDIQLAQAIYGQGAEFGSDYRKDVLIDGVLRKYKITQAELDSSLFWYAENIQYYNNITDSVSTRLRRSSSAYTISAKGPNAQFRADMIIPPFYSLNEYTPTLSFNIDSTRIKTIKVSDFKLKFGVLGLNDQIVDAVVYYTYKDTLIKNMVSVTRDSQYDFTKPNLPDSLLKSITGYMHLNKAISIKPSNVLLYNISYIDSLSVSSEIDSLTNHKPIDTIQTSSASSTLQELPKEESLKEDEQEGRNRRMNRGRMGKSSEVVKDNVK